ncbi:hypothetical protein ACU6TU_14100 [Halomonas sp. LS-001]
MIWHLIAAVFAGLAAAGIGLFLRTLSGKRLPKWIIPVFAGLGMLGYQVYTEYTWFDHKQQQLPEAAEVVSSQTSSAVWRPWTFAFPMTTKFTVVDRESINITETPARVAAFMLYHFERHYTDAVTPQRYLLNCESRELVPVKADSGEPDTQASQVLREGAGTYKAVCSTDR